MEETIRYLQLEIYQLKISKKPFPDSIKKKATELLLSGKSLRNVANNIGIHPSTLFKWNKKFKDQEKTSLQTVSTVVDNQVLKKLKTAEIKEETQRNIVSKKRVGVVFLFLCVFFFCEYYLLNQSYLFHLLTLKDKSFALTKSIITELIPISLTIAIFTLETKIFEKMIIFICLISSFILSAYNSAAFSLNEQSDEISKNKIILEEKAKLQKDLKRKDELIKYYQNKVQTNGVIGWPLTINKLEIDRENITNKISIVQNDLKKIGNIDLNKINMWLDLSLKILIQFTCTLILSLISQNIFKDGIRGTTSYAIDSSRPLFGNSI